MIDRFVKWATAPANTRIMTVRSENITGRKFLLYCAKENIINSYCVFIYFTRWAYTMGVLCIDCTQNAWKRSNVCPPTRYIHLQSFWRISVRFGNSAKFFRNVAIFVTVCTVSRTTNVRTSYHVQWTEVTLRIPHSVGILTSWKDCQLVKEQFLPSG
jgi:hypothetical protein